MGIQEPQSDMGRGEALALGVAGGDVDLREVPDGFDNLLLLGPEGSPEDTLADPSGVGLDAGGKGLFVLVGKGIYVSIVNQ